MDRKALTPDTPAGIRDSIRRFLQLILKFWNEHANVRVICRTTVVAVILSFIMAELDFSGFLAGPEGKLKDFIWLKQGKLLLTQDLTILAIDDLSFKRLFNRQSPMDPKIVTQIVAVIADQQPKVLGVDIFTDSSGTNGGKTYREFAQRSQKAKIVWMAGAIAEPSGDMSVRFDRPVNFIQWLKGVESDPIIQPTEVLGFDPTVSTSRTNFEWGPTLYPTDDDMKLRQFPREIKVRKKVGDKYFAVKVSSWAKRIAEVATGNADKSSERKSQIFNEATYLTFAESNPTPQSLDHYVERTSNGVRIRKGVTNDFRELIKGKVVLLGGTFSDSHDFHETPGGRMAGIFINARAVATELAALPPLLTVKQPLSFWLDVIAGLMSVVLLAFLSWLGYKPKEDAKSKIKWSFGFAAVFYGVLLFGFHWMFGLLTVLLGTTIQQLYDFWHDADEEAKAIQEPETTDTPRATAKAAGRQ